MTQEKYGQFARDMGYLLLKTPPPILDEVKISVDDIQKDFNKAIPHNHKLIGQIDKEYKTVLTPKVTQFIKWAVEEFNKHNPQWLKNYVDRNGYSNPKLVYKGDAWINFQEKYEYNPIHTHDGVFSYVIWYQIPYYKEDERIYGAGKKSRDGINLNGDFCFAFSSEDYSITCISLGIDKDMEGYIAIFPSKLDHTVYPFYSSDDYRITVSGNIGVI